MSDLHQWITQQVDAAEAYALDHIINPTNALRRCEADRRILDRHRLDPDVHSELLDLGYAHGLTPEILATFEQPGPA